MRMNYKGLTGEQQAAIKKELRAVKQKLARLEKQMRANIKNGGSDEEFDQLLAQRNAARDAVWNIWHKITDQKIANIRGQVN